MSDSTLLLIGILWLICGFIAGAIAHSKGASFGGFFIVGLLLGVLGVLIAALIKVTPPPPQPPGWYPDPWAPAVGVRYYDGHQWTYHTQAQQAA